MSSLRKEVLASKVHPSKLLPPIPRRTQGPRGRMRQAEDFVPISWDKYFTDCRKVEVEENSFNVYTLGDSGPLLVLLHGGGYSGLTWSLFAKEIYSMVDCQILAIDLRGHGSTTTTNDDDLSEVTLAKDVGDVITALYPETPPPIILMGHSMGGAIAIHTTYNHLIDTVIGLIVIDVVEGTAVDALASMQSFLRSRPTSFKSIQDAISWSLFNGQVKNVESAQVSVPGQIKNAETGVLAACEEPSTPPGSVDEPDVMRPAIVPETIQEDEAEFKVPVKAPGGKYTWRIDLCKTEKYWRGWFQGLSNIFLSSRAQKLLLLANIDRLDKNLTVGQMQGKFAMHVLTKVGHAVHEDEPGQVAEIVANFIVRNKFSQPKENFRVFLPAC
ncbi:protein phosphatase methylesterase 1 [Planococcus citri]|uniref:protein phosphatase methylesterase 1 n=1 Tax=Planococcus citri TaxID=170843 RepID=UPI0031F7E1E5